jgi:hypothetical protein
MAEQQASTMYRITTDFWGGQVRQLGQLQPFIAALPQEYMDQLASFGQT